MGRTTLQVPVDVAGPLLPLTSRFIPNSPHDSFPKDPSTPTYDPPHSDQMGLSRPGSLTGKKKTMSPIQRTVIQTSYLPSFTQTIHQSCEISCVPTSALRRDSSDITTGCVDQDHPARRPAARVRVARDRARNTILHRLLIHYGARSSSGSGGISTLKVRLAGHSMIWARTLDQLERLHVE